MDKQMEATISCGGSRDYFKDPFLHSLLTHVI